jgi:hypothetical protein
MDLNSSRTRVGAWQACREGRVKSGRSIGISKGVTVPACLRGQVRSWRRRTQAGRAESE